MADHGVERVLFVLSVLLLLHVFSFWQRVDSPESSFSPRASAISAYFPASQRWLIFSGYTDANGTGTTLYDAWRSDSLGMTWSKVAPVPFLRCEMAADTVITAPGVTSLFASGGIDFVSYESYNDVSSDAGTPRTTPSELLDDGSQLPFTALQMSIPARSLVCSFFPCCHFLRSGDRTMRELPSSS